MPCRSRWQNGGKGHHNGSGKKGYGKGYGKSKGFFRNKGKGKSKWAPREGFGGKGSYGFYQKTLTGSFGEAKRLSPVRPIKELKKAVHFRLDTDDDDPVLLLGKLQAREAKPSEEAGASASAEKSCEKRLDFSFATNVYNSSSTFHTVLGEKRRGLLVDPGAASGLIGSETLRDMLENCVSKSQSEQVSWKYDKTNNVSGISGSAESTLGEVSLPVNLAGASGSFRADVLGGEGSLCPALLSNPALRKQHAAILSNYFTNGDGVMAILGEGQESEHRSGRWHFLRLLLTDSGHYLLPVDDPRPVSQDTINDVNKLFFAWGSEIASRWDDVRHCFLQGNGDLKHRERERYPKVREVKEAMMTEQLSSTTTRSLPHEAASSSQTFSTTTDTTAATTEAETKCVDSSPREAASSSGLPPVRRSLPTKQRQTA